MLLAIVPIYCKDGREHFKCERILSASAIAIISQNMQHGRYRRREDAREPPFMAPSMDPDDYSLVCGGMILWSGRI